jgi:hypothetical protein
MARHFLESYPELAVFLAVGLGYILGDIKIAGIAFGPVTGSLLAGLAIGQFAEVPISGMAKSFLFLLFLFGIGYSVGPQFLQSMQRDGLRALLLCHRLHRDGPRHRLHVSRFLGLDPGYSAGLLSGGLTQSAAMGTATEAVNRLAIAGGAAGALRRAHRGGGRRLLHLRHRRRDLVLQRGRAEAPRRRPRGRRQGARGWRRVPILWSRRETCSPSLGRAKRSSSSSSPEPRRSRTATC